MTEYSRHSQNYPITDSGSIDMLGDEFPSPFYTEKAALKSPLMADCPGADISNWSDRPRPTVTAWEGSGLDAYYLADADTWTWVHCRTGRQWVPPVTLEAATASFCDMLMARNARQVA